jgi:hypothetical protein
MSSALPDLLTLPRSGRQLLASTLVTGVYNKRSHDWVWSWLKDACRSSSLIAKFLEISGSVASFATWQSARELDGVPTYRTRGQLWQAASERLQRGKATVLELGVASGDATRFWLSMVRNPELEWHGFDTFTGLPEPWVRGGIRFAEPGTFDAGGAPPDVTDPRVIWHVGRIEETLPGAEIDFESPLCVLFDLDLYGPSAFALEWLLDHLKRGDLLYFDEAYDPWHERRLLDEFLDRGHRVRAIGSTGIALMLEYRGSPTQSLRS